MHVLRIFAISIGIALIALAVPAREYTGRLVLGGVALALVGWLWQPLAARYRGVALVVLNTLVLLAAVELAATALLAVVTLPAVKALVARLTGQTNDLIAHYAALPYYRKQPWSEQHWKDFRPALKKMYSPYVVWRSPPYSSDTINIDADGIRYTPGAECGPDSFDVFVFGGSAAWGWGSPDWGTIAAHLQEELARTYESPVCVVNFGEQAFVSTQNLVQLALELQRGNVPELVLFYDGVNEVLAASQTRRPVLHQNYAEIAGLFQGNRESGQPILRSLSTVRLARMVLARIAPGSGPPADPRALATPALIDAVVETYLENLRLAGTLAEEYGFDLHFILQPYVLAGDKPLTEEERRMIGGLSWVLDLDEDLRQLFEAIYDRIGREAVSRPRLHDLRNVFDDESSQVWLDTWGHVTPEGNRIVARRIAKILDSGLAPLLEAQP